MSSSLQFPTKTAIIAILNFRLSSEFKGRGSRLIPISAEKREGILMSSNRHEDALEPGITLPESITTAMESINTLAAWLVDAALDETAIAIAQYRIKPDGWI
jgi:hypothetical protein